MPALEDVDRDVGIDFFFSGVWIGSQDATSVVRSEVMYFRGQTAGR